MATADELYQEAEKLKDQGQLEDAIARLKLVLEQDSGHLLSHLALAVVLGKVHRHEEAVKHAQRACELDPADPFCFTAMSVTYQRAFAGTQNHHYIHLAEEAMARAHLLQSRR